ncbi:hypothetical protein RFI_27478 [Reticulomyxa filosa]|uniref:Exoribonuclease Xrn1 D2/D3 domain-containing protein n=1 Tax=Reticulomyxa filosa TaxID=46433 RepID=X6M7M1_RETFI|nr:hypothetical protein RFI_27478 [Reticulomyxa filosa]|eukprot:ETO09899.1 hypothetical protein RFI_27478 [Reticulomyxa filosa]
MYTGQYCEFLGKVGRILLSDNPDSNCVNVQVTIRFEFKNFAYDLIKTYQQKIRYYSLNAAAREVGTSPNILSRLCGVIIARHGREDFDLGLKLKITAQQLLVPGYVRATPRSYNYRQNGYNEQEDIYSMYHPSPNLNYEIEFSDKAIDLLIDYKKKFPLVFELLERNPGFRFSSVDFATSTTIKEFVTTIDVCFLLEMMQKSVPEIVRYVTGTNVKEKKEDYSTSSIKEGVTNRH